MEARNLSDAIDLLDDDDDAGNYAVDDAIYFILMLPGKQRWGVTS